MRNREIAPIKCPKSKCVKIEIENPSSCLNIIYIFSIFLSFKYYLPGAKKKKNTHRIGISIIFKMCSHFFVVFVFGGLSATENIPSLIQFPMKIPLLRAALHFQGLSLFFSSRFTSVTHVKFNIIVDSRFNRNYNGSNMIVLSNVFRKFR